MRTNLTLLDWLVVLIPFFGTLGLTIWIKRSMHSVADFLAARRCAGRYLICTAAGEAGAGIVVTVGYLEMFSKAGFSQNFWTSIGGILTLLLPLIGLIVYRYRETKALTFHQFFEVRYSRGVRVYASALNVFSGLFSFGIQPAIGARFFVYFCGFEETLRIGGMTVPTFVPIMLVLMGISLYMSLSGGLITVIVNDFFEGIFSMVCYLIVAVAILWVVSMTEVREALLSGVPGKSYIDPFDISGHEDFNGWYVVFSILFSIYIYRGFAWNQGFAAAALTPHESKMAGILASWRMYGSLAMTSLVAVAAFTVLHHPDFSANQEMVNQGLAGISNPQLQTQMAMPLALGTLLGPGIKGIFCAIAFFGIISSQGAQLHGFGSTFLQDVILPLRRVMRFPDTVTPGQHIRWLRRTAIFMGLFACAFSILFKPVDYLVMLTRLIGSLYLGGIGVVVWCGLYWARGTAAGAWTALVASTLLAVLSNLIQQFWSSLAPGVAEMAGSGPVQDYLLAHAARCPLNGIQLAVAIAGICTIGYLAVSWLTCRVPHNMDRLLHRGAYRDPSDPSKPLARLHWSNIIGLDANHTRGDKVITIGTFAWGIGWKLFSIGILTWTLLVGKISSEWWFGYASFTSIYMPLALGVLTTIWFIWGGMKDFRNLLVHLKTVKENDKDDGQHDAV